VTVQSLIRDNPLLTPAQIDERWPKRMVWTCSAMKCFRSCPRKFYWRYLLRLRTRIRSMGLMIGGHLHDALEWWYARPRANHEGKFGRIAAALEKEATEAQEYYDEDEYAKLVQQVNAFRGMIAGYTDVYHEDRAMRRLVVERPFCVDCGEFDFAGKVDLIATLPGKPAMRVLMDHKTAGNVNTAYIERLPLDVQMRGYVFGASIGLDETINAVVYNIIRKCKLRRKSNEPIHTFGERVALDYAARPDFYFHREVLRYSRDSIEQFQLTLNQVHEDYAQKAQYLEASDPLFWPINDRECTAFFRLCEYFPLCSQGLDQGTALAFRVSDEMHEELKED
jgi:hypothetical protein